jgi:hypothetical protein
MLTGVNETVAVRRVLQKVVIYLAAAVAYYAMLRFLVDLPDGVPRAGLLRGVARAEGWRLFFGVLVPVAWLLPVLCGELICTWWQRLAPDSKYRQHLALKYMRYEFYSLGLLGLMALGFVSHSLFTDFHTVLGLIYLLILAAKTGLLIWLLNQAGFDPALQAEMQGKPERLISWGLGLICWALFMGLGFWTLQAISSMGPEVDYLIRAKQLLAGMGLAGGDLQNPSAHLAYYWDAWPPVLPEKNPGTDLFVWLLAPFFWLGERMGVLVFMAGAAGLTMSLFYRLCRSLGYARPRSMLATWVLAFSPPMLIFSQQVYPEMLGALGACLGMLLLVAMSAQAWAGIFWLTLLCAGLWLCKPSLIPLAVALWAAGLFRFLWLTGGKRLVKWGLLAVLLCLALMILGAPGFRDLSAVLGEMAGRFRSIPNSYLAALGAGFALIFDQQFGLLAYAPWLLFSLAGLVFFLGSQKTAARSSLWVCGFFGLTLVLWNWPEWQGGFSPPGRMLLAVMPVLALWALPALSGRAPGMWRNLFTACFGLGLLTGLVMTLLPMLRFNRLSGVNNLLLNLGELTGTGLGRFFPSFVNLYWPDMAMSLIWVGLVAVLMLWLAIWRRRPDQGRLFALGWRGAGFILVVGFLILVALGRYAPTTSLQAEAMMSGGTAVHAGTYPDPVYRVFSVKGSWLKAGFIWGGKISYLILAAHHAPAGSGGQNRIKPALQLIIDGKIIREIEINQNRRRYRTRLHLQPGWHELELVFSKQQGRDQVWLDRVEFD